MTIPYPPPQFDIGNSKPIEKGVYLPRYEEVRHLIENGALVYTYLDLETTDKDWKSAEMTLASLTITDIGFNLISDDLFEVRVPDRVGLSPEAMLITRYMASKLRQADRLPPQIAAAQIYEAIQDAPKRLWASLDKWKDVLGPDLWEEYVDERIVPIPGRTGITKEILTRYFPMLDKNNQIIKCVRIHEPSPDKEFMDMSYLVKGQKDFDYEDEQGRWKIRQLDKYNLGFRNTFFDNRLMAAALFRANFPQKQIYALNRKALGNHAADVFTMALSDHFFGTGGEKRIKLGTRIDHVTTREKISAKLDLIMEENTRMGDSDVDLPEGIRVLDGTLHNLKRGHNAPDYDNAKSIGVHRYIREHNPSLIAQIENCGNIDFFRRFMTHDIEEGIPTTHPIRFGIISANDDQIYRAVPLIILGSDDQHGKFNKIWTVRADINFDTEQFKGKRIPDLSAEDLAELIRIQKGQPDAIFHEIHLKRHRGVFDLETGLKAGHAAGLTKEVLRYRRDSLIDHLDEFDRPFLGKILDAFSMQYSFSVPADDIPQPYVEEEIWTAMGDIKYPFVTLADGRMIKLPNVIREMAQDEFKRLNDKLGDCIRALLRPQPLEWKYTPVNALAYARLRAKQEKKIEEYQSRLAEKDKIRLPFPDYPFSNSEVLKKNPPEISVQDAYATLLQDRLFLMDKVHETTRSYEVQESIVSTQSGRSYWQTIPFETLANMSESRILALRDEGRIRIVFEQNPNRPSFRFAIRNLMEGGCADLLNQSHRDFYLAETSAYAHGPIYIQDPEKHRVMSGGKIQLSIDRIRQNILNGQSHLAATRLEEKGVFDIYANDNFAESILNNVEIDTRRRLKSYPFSKDRKLTFGINPDTDEPLLNIKYPIPEKCHVIKVPDSVPFMPTYHPQMGHTCIIVPALPEAKISHLLVQEEKTGRKYYIAEPIIHEMPSRTSGAYDDFYRMADNAYRYSGATPPERGYVISCREIAPVTNFRDKNLPSVRISMDQLLATRNPRLGNLQRDEPLGGFIMRKYDLKLKDNQKIILRGTDRDEKETGWEAAARISGKPDEFSLYQILQLIDDPERQNEADCMASECGYGTSLDMKAALLSQFTKFDEDILSDQNELIFFKIKPAKEITFWMPHQPRAAYESDLLGHGNSELKMRKARLAAKSPVLTIK